jgi:hypothetical protein
MPKNSNDSVIENKTQEIALRLFFKNPYAKNVFNEHSEIEQVILKKDLFGAGDIELDSILLDTVVVKIKYQDGLLSIKTTDEVDVFLSGVIPAQAVHIETHGCCALVDGEAKGLSMGLFIKANGIVLDMPIMIRGFAALLPASRATSAVQIKQPIDVALLRIDALDILLGAKVQSGKAILKCNVLHNFEDGELITGKEFIRPIQNNEMSPFSSKQLLDWNEAVDKHSFIEEHDHLRGKIYRLTDSLIIARTIINEGALNLVQSIITGCNIVRSMPNSKVVLKNVKVFSKELLISNLANVTGINTSLQISEKLNIEGSCIIDGLTITAPDMVVSGLLWGDSNLNMQIKEDASFHGIVGAKHTTIKSKYILATVILGNEGLFYKGFVNGGIIGTSTLTIESAVCVRAAGAYLYAPSLFLKNGIDVGLFSCIMSYNRFKNCLYEYCSLEVTGICRPESIYDLMSPSKLLRVAEMIGGNFPVLRGTVAFLNIGMLVGSGGKTALTAAFRALREDPNLLHQLQNLGHAGKEKIVTTAKSVQDGSEYLANLATGEWNTDTMKELVDVLLEANGLRITANAIVSQATGALVFVNDLQNINNAGSNSTDEAAERLAATVLDNIKGLNPDGKFRTKTAFGPLAAAKLVNDTLTGAKKSTLTSSKDKKDSISLIQAAKNVVYNQVSEIINAPMNLVARAEGAVEAIKSISLEEAASQLFASTNDKVDGFMTAANAVWNAEPTPFPIHAPIVNEEFIFGMAKESAKLLAPSVYTTSFVSDTGGLTFTGNYIVNTGFYRNSGMVVALGTSVHCLYDSTNYGTIFSQRHTETARSRNNYGIVSATEANIDVLDNNEYGTTEASTRMLFNIKSHYVAEGAKFRSSGQTSGHISGKMVIHGQQDLRNGHLQHDGITEIGTTADTTLKSMTLDLKHDFDVKGNVHLERVSATSTNPVTFKDTSNTYVNNVIINAPSVYREDGSVINIENKLLFDAEYIGAGLNSVLQGTTDSIFATKSKTFDDHGSHAIGNGIFYTEELSPDAAFRLAAGLGEHENKNYSQSILVSTQSTESLIYAPISRTDDAAVTLLTGGTVSLPPAYDARARGLTFNTHREAERFVAGYDGYGLSELPQFNKSIKQNFLEEATKASAVGFTLGIISGIAGSGTGFIVALASLPTGMFTGHKARKAARKEQARINDELTRRANTYREIDQRLLAHGEKEDLAELYNNYNSYRIDGLHRELYDYNNSDVVIHGFTTRNMLQYKEYINEVYQNRRLESTRHHDEYAKKISNYISERAAQIRKSVGFNISVGASTKFGGDGYTVSATYSGGFGGGTSIHGSVPIYEKTYTRPSRCQQPVEPPSNLYNTYQWPELPLTIYDDLEFTVSEAGLIGTRHRDPGITEAKNDGYGEAEEECTYIHEPVHSGNLNGSTQFINNMNQKTQVTNTSEQTVLGNISYQSAVSYSQPDHYRSIWDISDQGLAAQAKYGSAYLLNVAYRGARFGISPIDMFAMGNELEYRQATDSG